MDMALAWAAGVTAVLFAALMLLSRSLYAGAICLLIVLLQTSVLFCLSGALLVGFLQIMISAGAVMVLVVVAIMASPAAKESRWGGLSIPAPLAGAGFLLAVLEAAIMAVRGGAAAAHARSAASLAQDLIGSVLFGPYALATEAVALLLFLAGLVLVETSGEQDAES